MLRCMEVLLQETAPTASTLKAMREFLRCRSKLLGLKAILRKPDPTASRVNAAEGFYDEGSKFCCVSKFSIQVTYALGSY